jgi:peroxiredoxin
MKKIICLLALTGFFTLATAQEKHYVLTAKIEGAEGVSFVLQTSAQGRPVYLDTVVVVNGSFTITGGSVDFPQMVSLVTLDRKKGLSFYLENREITITANIDALNRAVISGSKTQDELLSLDAAMKALTDRYQTLTKGLQEATQANDKGKMADLTTQLNSLVKEAKAIQKDFVVKHPASFATPQILGGLMNDFSATEIEGLIASMSPEVAATPAIVDLKFRLVALKKVDIGQKPPDFTLPDTDGKPVSLYSKVGARVLLVDFWAGWCSPCRKENPNVVKVYKEFHEKGFDILGVSLDQTEAVWKKAIADDKLTWTQVSDLKYWNSVAAKLYAVNSIPANFLLDKNGIIVAKNLRGEELYNKIKKLINSK